MKKQKKADINTKVGKYFMAVRKGKTKKEAQIVAGYKTDTHATTIEKSSEFKALQTRFGASLIQKISIDEINDALVDNIKQIDPKTGVVGRIDRNARNKAIEIAKDFIEPNNGGSSDEGDKVLIVLSK